MTPPAKRHSLKLGRSCIRLDDAYENLSDLPDSVKDNLPKHAQEIYLKAFNSAWEQYARPEERRGHASREETAHKVAWAAVKQEYKKDDDRWVSKEGFSW